MEFTYDGTTYRVERGRATGVWILVANVKLEAGNNWRLLNTFDAAIYEEDIMDRASTWVKEGL